MIEGKTREEALKKAFRESGRPEIEGEVNRLESGAKTTKQKTKYR